MSSTAPAASAPRVPFSLSWLLTLGAVVAIGPLTIDMYLPALPALEKAFGAGPARVQWTLAAYFLGIAVGQLAYGPISDRYGRKRPLLAGLALYVIASVACAHAPLINDLIALRLLQALGGCAGMVLTRAMVRDRFAPQDMARILSQLVLVMGVAPMLAPLAGSLVLEFAGWQAIFWVLAVFGVLCMLAVAMLDETHPTQRRLVSLSVLSALHGYAHLMRHRKFVGYALSGAAAQSGMFAYISVSSFVFIQHFGLSPSAYSMLFGTNAFGLIASSQVNGLLLRRVPAQIVLSRALQTYLAAGVLMALSAITGIGGIWGIALPLWICIASLGFTFPNSVAAAMAPFGDRAGSASALMGTLQFGAAGVASYLVGHLYDGTPRAMAVTIAVCGLIAVTLLRKLAHPES